MDNDGMERSKQLILEDQAIGDEDIEAIVSAAKVKMIDFEKTISDLKSLNSELAKRKSALEPLLEDIEPQLKRLNELKKLRNLLLKLQELKTIHVKLEKLNKLKTTKQSEVESRLFQCIELYKQLTKEWKTLVKVKDDNAYKLYLKEMILFWNSVIREKVEPIFEGILKTVNWPILRTNISNTVEQPISPDCLNRFKQYFTLLFELDVKHLFLDKDGSLALEPANSFNTIPICLPLELMVLPLRKRFTYHFMTNARTNQLSKPEWYLTQIMNWIKDHEDFLAKYVIPLLKERETEFAPIKIQFASALLELAAEKLEKDLPKLSLDEKLFSHAFDEVLLTQKELDDTNQGWLASFKENCNLLGLFAVEPYFTRLRNIERRRSMEYIETIISSETAWEPLVSSFDDDDDDDDVLKVPEIADNFILMLQSITDRFSHLSKISHQYAFIVLELEMLADFHLRLSQIYRSLDTVGPSEWPFSKKFFSILNTLNYVILTLNSWRSLSVFQDMSEFSLKDSIFDDSLSLYHHMANEMKKRIIDSLMKLVIAKVNAYANLRWHCFSPLDDDMQYVSYQLFYLISESLELLRRKLSQNIFRESIDTLADSIKTALLKEVVLKNSFNNEGSQQFHRDVSMSLFSVFRAYTPNPEDLFMELVEACHLLNLAKGNSLLLQDTLKKGNISEDDLKDFNINRLSPKTVLKILSKRFYT